MTSQELEMWMFTKFPLCGCGDTKLVVEKLLSLLNLADPDWMIRTEPTSADDWLWLYVLDHAGLIEHGGSVSSGWLTEKGIEVRCALRLHGCDSEKWNVG